MDVRPSFGLPCTNWKFLIMLSLLGDKKGFFCEIVCVCSKCVSLLKCEYLYPWLCVCVLWLFVCKIDSPVLWLPGIISSQRDIFDKARANIFINGRIVKRHWEGTETPSHCGASPCFQRSAEVCTKLREKQRVRQINRKVTRWGKV